jgi:peptidyl-dipeptidase A
MKRYALLLIPILYLAGCEDGLRSEVDAYLAEYAGAVQGLYYESSQAEWASNTHIVEGDPTNAERTARANEALAAFVGSVENIERINGYLEERDRLTALQVRQLEAMLYEAANQPFTVPELVKERIAAEAKQTETLFGYEYTLYGRPITPNEIDELLRTTTDLNERRAVWEASKQSGPALKPGIVDLQSLRNETVRALGYSDFYSYQISEYDMTTDEMLELTEKLVEQTRPLYRELHTWARYELADRYGVPVPENLPAHWLPNRWGQDWTALVTVEGLDIAAALADKPPEWIIEKGEEFYQSLGFTELPETFWALSSLYPLPHDATYKKNTHASAWHMDLENDVRSLMSVESNPYWWETTLHELGHIYYYISYTRPEVPLVLRGGANRAYHEGIGYLMGLASMQRSFLVGRGLVPPDAEVDLIGKLLRDALNYIVFTQWSAGVMTQFEYELYANDLSPDEFNAMWWDLKLKYQGIVPPTPRGEEWADALTKTHINDDAGQYYDYALSYALLFQLHDHIARNILEQDPYDSDYWGSAEVGDFLSDLMSPGASRPWREVIQETTGRELDAQPIVDYFQPLYEWLVEQNEGREHTLM